jgi:hypothetical protein
VKKDDWQTEEDFDSEEEWAVYLTAILLKTVHPEIEEGYAYETMLEYLYADKWNPAGIVNCGQDILNGKKLADGERHVH